MTDKHTPGPWTIAPRTRGRGDRLDIVTDWTLEGKVTRLHIASAAGALEPKYSTCANARLIAAAPELLEALELAIHKAEQIRDGQCNPIARADAIIQVARAAIKAAKGDA